VGIIRFPRTDVLRLGGCPLGAVSFRRIFVGSCHSARERRGDRAGIVSEGNAARGGHGENPFCVG
jgi:hypothetical protein